MTSASRVHMGLVEVAQAGWFVQQEVAAQVV